MYNRDFVGLDSWSAWRRTLSDLAGRDIQLAEIAARVVRVPDVVLRVDGDAPRAGVLVGQHPLVNLHGVGIDAGDFGRAELAENRDALGGDDHAVGIRLRRRRGGHFYFACRRHQPPDHVGALHAKPQRALLVEDGRVRIARGRRQLVFGELARLRIELADIAL